MRTIKNNIPHSSELKMDMQNRGRILKVTAEEYEGILNVLNNPRPPSTKMKDGWKEYMCHVTNNLETKL